MPPPFARAEGGFFDAAFFRKAAPCVLAPSAACLALSLRRRRFFSFSRTSFKVKASLINPKPIWVCAKPKESNLPWVWAKPKIIYHYSKSVRFSYGLYDILFRNQFSGRKIHPFAPAEVKEKIAFRRLSAAKQRRFVRNPYGTFVILLVDSIIQYRLPGSPPKSASRNNLSLSKQKTK